MTDQLTPESTVLIVMDVQERLVAAMNEDNRGKALDNVIRLVQGARILGIPLLVTQQYPAGLGPTIESVGHAIKEFDRCVEIIDKVEFDACRDENFTRALEKCWADRSGDARRSVVLSGMETHICVYQTARSLVGQGYQVLVPADATCCRLSDNHAIAQSLLKQAGAVVSSTETVLFELLGRAGSEQFKAISKLVR